MSLPRSVFISVAEDSADLHGATLVRAARRRWPDVRFSGFAGPRMAAEGVHSLLDLTGGAAMLAGILRRLGSGWRALAAARRAWRHARPDLVILMDSTALHLPMAAAAKRQGLPVLYYISPQTWASRPGRNRRLARDVDHVACILPFEESYLRSAGVQATYVGHPLFEALVRQSADPQTTTALAGPGPLVALLPGSRSDVIERMLPLQLQVIARLRQRPRIAVSCASDRRRRLILRILAAHGCEAPLLQDQNAGLLRAADLVLVASGTATLEVAYHRTPMVVMYDAGMLMRILYRLGGKRWIQTRYLSLVNILAGDGVVPEFMPFVPRVDDVARAADALLADPALRQQMRRRLEVVIRPLEDSRASDNVCDLIEDMLGPRL